MIAAVLVIVLAASGIGAICGIGGGIIIKPVMDAAGVADPATVNFLSGCTVLSMTLYSVLRAWASGRHATGSRVADQRAADSWTDLSLAMGAAVGGLVGKRLFDFAAHALGDLSMAGALQASALFAVTLGTLVYTVNRDRIESLRVEGVPPCLAIGLALGTCSSFLGIGGGPINLVVLFHFFGMSTKRAAASSLRIILLSQGVSTLATIADGGATGVDASLLVAMVACGIVGGMVGRKVNARIDDAAVSRLFVGLMVVILVINVFNVAKFLA